MDRRFPAFLVVELTPETALHAGARAAQRALRGYDAIHLACALRVWANLGEAPTFARYDDLLLAAEAGELPVWPPLPKVGQ